MYITMYAIDNTNLHVIIQWHVIGACIYVRQPHQTSDMLPNFKMIFAYLKTLMASKCKNNYGAASNIGEVMKDYVQKG